MAQKITLSACLIVRDEEQHLPGCLDSLRPMVDEIIVVDTGSRDRTREVAREGGAKVFRSPWKEDFAEARNRALDQALGDWILVIDADERLEWEGYEAFRAPLQDPEKWGFLLTLVNQHEEGTSEVLLLRLFRNHPEILYEGSIHERVEPSLNALCSDFQKAVGRHGARIHHTGYLEQIRRERGKDERDMALLRKEREAAPADAYFHYKFAAHPHARLHCAGEVEEALDRAWDLVREQDPRGGRFSYTPEVAALRLLSLLSQRKMEALLPMAVEAGKMERTSPNLAYALGLCHLMTGNLAEASGALEKSLSMAGQVLPCAPFEGVTGFLSLSALSEVRYLQGEKEESIQLFTRAAESLDGELANAFHGTAVAVARGRDPGLAMILLSQASRREPQDPFPWNRGGEILLAMKLHDRALEWLKCAVTLAPYDRHTLNLLEEVQLHHIYSS